MENWSRLRESLSGSLLDMWAAAMYVAVPLAGLNALYCLAAMMLSGDDRTYAGHRAALVRSLVCLALVLAMRVLVRAFTSMTA